MSAPCVFFQLGVPPLKLALPRNFGNDIWRSWQDEVSITLSASEGPWVEEMWPPTSLWYPVAMYLATWTAPEDRDEIRPAPEIKKALESMELSVLQAHREMAGWVAWMCLAVLQHTSQEMQDQAQQVRQLQHQEEMLQEHLAAAGYMLQGLEEFAQSSRAGSPISILQARPLVQQKIELEQQMGPGGQPLGALQAKQHMTMTAYLPAELRELMKQVQQRAGEMVPGWLLRLWDEGTEGTELFLDEISQLASITVLPSLRQSLNTIAHTNHDAGNRSLINWLMAVA